MTTDPSLEAFVELVREGGDSLPLDRGALEIARIAYPELAPDPWLRALDELAERTARLGDGRAEALGLASVLNRSLFEREGFRGNETDYFEPRNSFLNDVLERRLGIPITLSLVYIEVARRLGLRIDGIGFPGHFLVRTRVGEDHRFLDPFHGGRLLSREDCQSRLDEAFGARVEMDPNFLEPVSTAYMLSRMLRNLKRIYISRRDHGRALAVVERLHVLRPDDPGELRDRGKLRLSLGDLGGAAADLERFLSLAPEPTEDSEARLLLQGVRRRQALVN